MEFRQIQYFLAICKYRNISHAAKAIHLSQQALSKQIPQHQRGRVDPLRPKIGGTRPADAGQAGRNRPND